MPSLHRVLVAATFATVLSSAAAAQFNASQMAQQQQEKLQPSDPTVPKVLINTFRMGAGTKPADAKLAATFAEELRQGVIDQIPEKELWVIRQRIIAGVLTLSQYRTDEGLSTFDLLTLGGAGGINSKETIDGTLTRLADGSFQFESRFFHRNNIKVYEPMPTVTGKKTGDLVKAFVANYKTLRKQLPSYRQCESALQGQKFDSAATYGRATIASYAPSNMGRLCMLTAFGDGKASPDSVIRVGTEILSRDTASTIALDYLRVAYSQKGDPGKAAELAVRIYSLNPGSADYANSAVASLLNSGATRQALPILDTLIANDPANKESYITKLRIQLTLKQYKDAFITADQVARIDTSVVTIDFIRQMIGAAQSDSNPDMAIKYAEQGAKKFPKDASLHMAHYSMLNRAGRREEALEAAKRAVAADPKVENGVMTVLGLLSTLGRVEEAIAFAKTSIASGTDPKTLGEPLIVAVGPALKKAQETKTREDWRAALDLTLRIDSVAPSPHSKFYSGIAGFSIAQLLPDLIVKEQADRPKACALTRELKEMIAVVNLYLMPGATVDRDVAGRILSGLPQYEPLVPQYERLYCGG